MATKAVDVLIIGGGLTGAALLLAVQDLGYSTLLVEAKPFDEKINPDFDARSLALSPASQRILSMLGVWDKLQEHATAIEMIHVSEMQRFGAARLHGEKNNPLGYVVEMHAINQALAQLLPQDKLLTSATLNALDTDHNVATVATATGEVTIHAKLIVAADGSDSPVRQFCGLPANTKRYEQQAIVVNVGLIKPHDYKAYERFTAHGPLALLPMKNKRMSVVWAVTPEQAERFMSLSEADFLQELQRAFGYRLGRFAKAGKRFSYPLKQVIMPQQAKWPVVFVGNAAHTLHPVAGQGFNLGLRDVATLAQCIASLGLNAEMLEEYRRLRSHDQQAITRLTNGLIELFTSRLPGLGVARTLGLVAFDNLPALKKFLARYARGFGGVIPDLVCDIALQSGAST